MHDQIQDFFVNSAVRFILCRPAAIESRFVPVSIRVFFNRAAKYEGWKVPSLGTLQY